MRTLWGVAGATLILGLVACQPHSHQMQQFSKLAAIEQVPPNALACQQDLPAPVCTGGNCRQLIKGQDTDGMIMSPEHPDKYQYLTRGFSQLLEHAAKVTECVTSTWNNNKAPVVIGDLSDEDSDTPYNRHPGNSHDGGVNADVGYFQLNYNDNYLRPVCEHQDNACVGRAEHLDAYKTAIYLAALHRNPNLVVIGVDTEVYGPIVDATKELCQTGYVKGHACRGLKLVKGGSWYRFHHHHHHTRLGYVARGPNLTIGVGDQRDNSSPWGNPNDDNQNDDQRPNDGQNTVVFDDGPRILDPRNNDGGEHCLMGYLASESGELLCSAWPADSTSGRAPYFAKRYTATCTVDTLGTQLSRARFNKMQEDCGGEIKTAEYDEKNLASQHVYAALAESDSSSPEQTVLAAAPRGHTSVWVCEGHDVDACAAAERSANKTAMQEVHDAASGQKIYAARSKTDIVKFTVMTRDARGLRHFRLVEGEEK